MWMALVSADTAAQLLFKAAAARLGEPRSASEWIAMVAQSPDVWLALLCLLLTFGCWMLILRRAPISSAYPVTSLSIVCVVVASRIVFGDQISPMQYAGVALIVSGVALLGADRIEPGGEASSS